MRRSARPSRERSAGARATRTSSPRFSGRPSRKPPRGRRSEMATVENLPSPTRERPIGFGRLKRKEDERFIRGKGNYLDDIRLPGMVHGAMLRSPYAHARI